MVLERKYFTILNFVQNDDLGEKDNQVRNFTLIALLYNGGSIFYISELVLPKYK